MKGSTEILMAMLVSEHKRSLLLWPSATWAAPPDGDSNSMSMWHISLLAARKALHLLDKGEQASAVSPAQVAAALSCFSCAERIENCLHALPAYPGLPAGWLSLPKCPLPTLVSSANVFRLHLSTTVFRSTQAFPFLQAFPDQVQFYSGGMRSEKVHAQGLGWERPTGLPDPSDSA